MTARRRHPKRGRRSRRDDPGRSRSEPAGETSICTLRIDRLAAGGDGIATRDDGKTVFVEDGVPGDVVRARIIEERKRFARALIDEVLEPSADRVEPRCEHFGRCGGCAWQHIRYHAQVSAKANILRDALQRIGGFTLASEPAMSASPLDYAYRGRARVRVEGGRVGFLERSSHRLCAIDECPVLAPELEAAVRTLGRRDHGHAGEPGAGEPAREIDDGEWSLCVGTAGEVSIAPPRDPASGSAPVMRTHADAKPVVDLPRAGPHPLDEDTPRVTPIDLVVSAERIRLDARSFSQANASLHATLVERTLAALFSGQADVALRDWTVLEVHAGVGFFTRPLARVVGQVVAVESDGHACAWLAENTASLPASVEIVNRTLEAAAPLLADRRFDAVLLDPPRTGLAPAELETLLAWAPPRVVYLSCDPATLARDARGLAEAGFSLEHVEGFDLFPQTPHTEGLVRLERR